MTAGAFQTGDVDPDAAAANRDLYERLCADESAYKVELPRRATLDFDRAPFHRPRRSPLTVVGHGCTVRNRHYAGGYPSNCTLAVAGGGLGWSDGFARPDPPEPGVVLLPPAVAARYQPGLPCWSFLPDGYQPGRPGMACRRHTVVACDAAAGRVKLDSDPAPDAASLKPIEGLWLDPVAPGDVTVTVPASQRPYLWGRVKPGLDVYVAGGPVVADECGGEWRVVDAFDPATGAVTLDRPLDRGWALPALGLLTPVKGLTLLDLIVGQPLHPDANPLFGKVWLDLALHGCRIGAAGGRTRPASLNTGAGLDVAGSSGSKLELNTATRVRVRGGTWDGLAVEESCFDGHAEGLTLVGGRTSLNGFDTHLDCSDWTLRDVLLTGFGVGGSPLNGDGTRCRFFAVRVANSRGDGQLWFGGAGNRFDGLESDRYLAVDAPGVLVSNSTLPALDLRAGAGGGCANVWCGPGQTYPAGRWTWAGGSAARPVPAPDL